MAQYCPLPSSAPLRNQGATLMERYPIFYDTLACLLAWPTPTCHCCIGTPQKMSIQGTWGNAAWLQGMQWLGNLQPEKSPLGCAYLTFGHVMQLREGVRTEAQALALGRQVVACRALHLRGLMTHHGNLTAFRPMIQAFKDNFGQVGAISSVPQTCHQAFCSQTKLLQKLASLAAETVTATAMT